MALRLPFQNIAKDGSLALIGRLFRETGRQFAPRYALVILLAIVIAATTALNAWLIKDVINQIFFDRRAEMLYFLTEVVVANGFVRGFSLYASAVTLGRIGNAVVARTQAKLYDHMLNLGVDFYNRTPSSELITRMSHNAQAARDVLNLVVNGIGRDLLTVVGLVLVMFFQSPLMSLVVLVAGPIAGIGIAGLVRRVRGVARAQFTSLSRVISDMQETAYGIRIVKAFNLEAVMKSRMARSIDEVRQRADKIVRISARSSPLMEVIGGFAIAMIVLWAGYQVIYFDVKPGALMSFIAAIALAYEPAKRLAQMQIQLEAGLVGIRLMYELLDTPPTMSANADGPDLKRSIGEVVFDKVDFGYRGEAPLFRKFDFVAAGGKTTALVGPSGSGKSTMMSLIERFYDAVGGRILIDGQDIAKVRTPSLRDEIALVTQDTYLFRDTIRENIRFGRAGASDAEIETAARQAMAHDFILATECGYDTVLGDQAAQLSGGQRQRIAIARAILRDAPIILLDEATSSLDSESEHQIQVALDYLMQGRTTIVIAHRLSTVLHADKICVLVDGAIVEQGRHDELMALGKHYARLYRLQFRERDDASGKPVAVPAE
ncbi:MAG: ABC transporter ATP-binding protein/permease [Bauldia sp.]|nr:ABC transporter ATP-binding protein/permease [Bauldia sp.]